jgi:predicted nucleic acid-binding protein
MSARSFVDANVLVYAQDRSAGAKHELAKNLMDRLWLTRSGVLSTQVLQEFCAAVIRKSDKPVPFAELKNALRDYLSWEIVFNAPDAVLGALLLQERYQISFWDALMIHAAEEARVDILYSEDLSHGQRYGNLRVINPFIQ